MLNNATAMVCAGQGAQTAGMGRDLAERYPLCRDLFARADETLGFELGRLCFEGPESELVKSNIAQPAIFTVTVACVAALRAALPPEKRQPAQLAGLSLGEWTALHLAGALSFEDTLRVLEARGRYMQEACDAEPGTMLSILGLDANRVTEIAATAGVEVANYNSPEQTVLSGRRDAMPVAEQLAKDAGAKRVVPLNVAGAYHSSLMAPAADKLKHLLADINIQAPNTPVISNVTGVAHSTPETIRVLMTQQVTSSVRWVDCIRSMQSAGAERFIECGPGRVLSGLIKRIVSGVELLNVQDIPSLERTAHEL